MNYKTRQEAYEAFKKQKAITITLLEDLINKQANAVANNSFPGWDKFGETMYSGAASKYNGTAQKTAAINAMAELKKLKTLVGSMTGEITDTEEESSTATTSASKTSEEIAAETKRQAQVIADYNQSGQAAAEGEDIEGTFVTTNDEYTQMASKYRLGINNLKQQVINDIDAFSAANYTNAQLKEAKDEVKALAKRIETEAQSYYNRLDKSGFQKYDISGKHLISEDTPGSFAAVSKALKTKAVSLQEKLNNAKSVEDLNKILNQTVTDLANLSVTSDYGREGWAAGSDTDKGGWFNPTGKINKTGGVINRSYRSGGDFKSTAGYRQLKARGYSDAQIKALSENTQTQTTSPVTSTGSGNSNWATGLAIAGTLGATAYLGNKGRKAFMNFLDKKGVRKAVTEAVEESTEEAVEQTSKRGPNLGRRMWENMKNIKSKAGDFVLGKKQPTKAKAAKDASTESTSKTTAVEGAEIEGYDFFNSIGAVTPSTYTTSIPTSSKALSKAKGSVGQTTVRSLSDLDPNESFSLFQTTISNKLNKVKKLANPTIDEKSAKTYASEINALDKTLARLIEVAKSNKNQNLLNSYKQLDDVFQTKVLGIEKTLKEGGTIYNEGGQLSYSEEVTTPEGITLRIGSDNQTIQAKGAEGWVDIADEKAYSYAVNSLNKMFGSEDQTQDVSQTTQIQTTKEDSNQSDFSKGLDKADKFFEQNQWVPFMGQQQRRDMDWLDYTTLAGGFIPGVGAAFEGVEAVRDLYDEYQADDLTVDDVIRNAGEIGLAFVGGKAIGKGADLVKKGYKALFKKSGGTMSTHYMMGKYGMKVLPVGGEFDKPIVDSDKLSKITKFKTASYKKGGKLPKKKESALEATKSSKKSKYNHLDEIANKLK